MSDSDFAIQHRELRRDHEGNCLGLSPTLAHLVHYYYRRAHLWYLPREAPCEVQVLYFLAVVANLKNDSGTEAKHGRHLITIYLSNQISFSRSLSQTKHFFPQSTHLYIASDVF